jgi:hypothetical protein
MHIRSVCASAPMSTGVLAAYSWAWPGFGPNSPYPKHHANHLVCAPCCDVPNAVYGFDFYGAACPHQPATEMSNSLGRFGFRRPDT